MPIFEYRCKECSTRFETLVLRSDEKVECPNCHGSELSKLISAHAIGAAKSSESACASGGCGGGSCPFPCG